MAAKKISNDTLHTAIVLYLERLPLSELANCSDIARVLIPEEPQGWERVLDILNAGVDDEFQYLSHRGWRTYTTARKLKALEEWFELLSKTLANEDLSARRRLDYTIDKLRYLLPHMKFLVEKERAL